MTTQQKIEKQQQLQLLLEAYGVKFHSGLLTSEDAQKYTKRNGAGAITTYVSGDVDLDGVFEEVKIEGIRINSTWSDAGFGTEQFPIYRITFE